MATLRLARTPEGQCAVAIRLLSRPSVTATRCRAHKMRERCCRARQCVPLTSRAARLAPGSGAVGLSLAAARAWAATPILTWATPSPRYNLSRRIDFRRELVSFRSSALAHTALLVFLLCSLFQKGRRCGAWDCLANN